MLIDEFKEQPPEVPNSAFDAPIPGQSLTQPPGAAPYEQPPTYADPDDAAEFVFDQMTAPASAAQIVDALESGVPGEMLANTIVRQGFNDGLWTVDTAMIIAEVVLGQIVALGKRSGVENMKVFNKEAKQQGALMEDAVELAAPEDTPLPMEAPVEGQSVLASLPAEPMTDEGGLV